MKIGVMTQSFRLDFENALKTAAALKADGIQFYASGGEMHFEKINSARRVELRRHISDMGLEISAVCGDFGGHGFQNEAENKKRIEDTKRVIDLALDLGSGIVTTHIGVIPSSSSNPRYAVMAKACEAMGSYAKKMRASLAIETGPEPASTLRSFLDDIGMEKGLGVNFDPANLVMVCRENIPEAVRILGKYIVHTHAKDGVNLMEVDAEKLYGSFAGDSHPGFNCNDYIRELPLGKGAVPFKDYISVLRETGYDGYLTIERETGSDPKADIAEAVGFLRELLRA